MSKSKTENTAYLKAKKANDFWGTVRRLIKYMASRFWWVVAVFVFASGSAILTALNPVILGKATTIMAEGLAAGKEIEASGTFLERYPIDFDAIKKLLIILIITYIIRAIARYLQGYITGVVAQRTVYDLRKDLKEKMKHLPIAYFDTHSVGDVMSRAVNDMDQIAATLQQSLAQFIISVVTFFAVLVTMLAVDWRMSLVVIASVGISFLLIAIVARRSQRQFARQQRQIGRINDHVEEIYSGHTIVRSYNQEDYEQGVFDQRNEKLYQASWRAQFLAGIMMPVVNLSRDFGYLAIALYGGWGVINGVMPIGNIQAFMQYVNQFSQPVRQISQLSNNIQVTIAACERIFEILDEEEIEETSTNFAPIDTDNIIEFEHVKFGYNPKTPKSLVLTDFNLDVAPGQMIAIVGPTGAGKSTLINLLERFYDVLGGSIRYQGIDLRDINRQKHRENISIVLQDTWLFKGTIWENIAYGNHDATDEQIIEAAKAAHVDEFVKRLPDGYQTIINEEGTNISHGQKQLITIARAFVNDPEILILDEATSSVDTRTELLIQKAMKNIMKGRTSFVVAHRLSTIRDADKIIVMNQGDVIETGTHDELMDLGGFYEDLYSAQFANAVEMELA